MKNKDKNEKESLFWAEKEERRGTLHDTSEHQKIRQKKQKEEKRRKKGQTG